MSKHDDNDPRGRENPAELSGDRVVSRMILREVKVDGMAAMAVLGHQIPLMWMDGITRARDETNRGR